MYMLHMIDWLGLVHGATLVHDLVCTCMNAYTCQKIYLQTYADTFFTATMNWSMTSPSVIFPGAMGQSLRRQERSTTALLRHSRALEKSQMGWAPCEKGNLHSWTCLTCIHSPRLREKPLFFLNSPMIRMTAIIGMGPPTSTQLHRDLNVEDLPGAWGHFVARGLSLGPNLTTEISMWARQVTSWPGVQRVQPQQYGGPWFETFSVIHLYNIPKSD